MANAMKQNKDILYILPEDKKLHRLTTGFISNIHFSAVNIKVWQYAGGWGKVLDEITENQLQKFGRHCYAQARILAIIDCDGNLERGNQFINDIPHDLQDRVFVLCIKGEIEDLKRELGYMSLEKIGEALANECTCSSSNPDALWQHERLRHNANEVVRLKSHVWDFIYKP